MLKYYFEKVHWFSILDLDESILQFDSDVIGMNENGESIPAYYVDDGEKLYVLLEEFVPNIFSSKYILYFENYLNVKVLNYDQKNIDLSGTNGFNVKSFVYIDSKFKHGLSDIETILDSINEDYKMPDYIKALFLQKYSTSQLC
nr:hypothetical protein [Abalone asfa-like virus]